MKKIIIVLSILLAGLLGYMIATAVNSEKDALYTDSTRQASIDKAVRSLVAEPDLELSLPSEPDDNILDKVTSGKVTYYLVLLPYKDKADKDFVGFIMKTDERKGKWRTDRISAFFNVNTKDRSTLETATYIYGNVEDPDNGTEVYFALGKAPDDTNATALGDRVSLDENGVFGVISTEQFSIAQ